MPDMGLNLRERERDHTIAGMGQGRWQRVFFFFFFDLLVTSHLLLSAELSFLLSQCLRLRNE